MASTSMSNIANGQKPQNPVAALSTFLDKFKPQMALALPKHLTADRMSRLALTAFSTTPALQNCEHKSIAASIMTASTLGLEIGVNGQGFLIPYGKNCQFVPGWKGLVDLVSRSGRATVWTGAVFQGDEFDYALGDTPFIRHRPGDEDDPELLTHVYAVGRARGSDHPVIEVWTMRKVWKHRDKYNKVGSRHYSFRDPEMYARKIPLLQVMKYMPQSIEVANAIAVANAADQGQGAVIEGDYVTVTDPVPDTPPAPPAAPRTMDRDTGEILQPDAGPAVTYAQVLDGMLKAKTLADFDLAADLIKQVADEGQRKELGAKHDALRAELVAKEGGE